MTEQFLFLYCDDLFQYIPNTLCLTEGMPIVKSAPRSRSWNIVELIRSCIQSDRFEIKQQWKCTHFKHWTWPMEGNPCNPFRSFDWLSSFEAAERLMRPLTFIDHVTQNEHLIRHWLWCRRNERPGTTGTMYVHFSGDARKIEEEQEIYRFKREVK